MISEISPFKDFVCIKVCHNRRVRCFGIVLVCPCLYTNRTSKELQTLLSLFFFRNLSFQIGGAAYTRNFTVFSSSNSNRVCVAVHLMTIETNGQVLRLKSSVLLLLGSTAYLV